MSVFPPSFEEIAPGLLDFVADLPILGHNVSFDVGFLRAYGAFRYNNTLDTYPMASVLLPSAGRYNLGALAQALSNAMTAMAKRLLKLILNTALVLIFERFIFVTPYVCFSDG